MDFFRIQRRALVYILSMCGISVIHRSNKNQVTWASYHFTTAAVKRVVRVIFSESKCFESRLKKTLDEKEKIRKDFATLLSRVPITIRNRADV